MVKQLQHWINGEYAQGKPSGEIKIEDPALGEVVATVPSASSEDLDHAVEIAKKAQKEWAKLSLAKRVDIMFKMRHLVLENQDKMAQLIVQEHGKNYSDAIGEIQRGRETLDYACGINANMKGEHSYQISTGVDIFTVRQPVGVVAGICPFNFPAMVPMWMHPLAIATGNAIIIKPASSTPSAALLTGELYKQAGLPDGIYQVLTGNRNLVTSILEHPGIDAISFVGSTPVAHIVQNTGVAHGKRVQALGGANNHAIVMPDADIDFAAKHISAAAFGAAGERCMALPVVVAVGSAGEKLAEKVKAHADKIHVDQGMVEGCEMGPVIDKKAQERIEGLITDAEERGATIVRDGRGFRPEGYPNGY
ncbi:MAG: aldehyde dehydrogenase family protein, partial [Varibaculum cambriense]|nr:aldehyde dehydrogenase family protein [Varibaculum cambriense]